MKKINISNLQLIWAALWGCLLLFLPMAALAQTPEDAVTVNDVARDLYCPLCSGLTVDVCELEVCDDMREVIQERLDAGENPEEIKSYFVQQYGQKVLGKPSTEGFHLTAWLMPFIGLLGAALVLVFWLRNRPMSEVVQPIRAQSAPLDDYHTQLEQELQRLE